MVRLEKNNLSLIWLLITLRGSSLDLWILLFDEITQPSNMNLSELDLIRANE